MMEVSSYEISVHANQWARKGQQIPPRRTQLLFFLPARSAADWVEATVSPFGGDYCSISKMVPVKSEPARVHEHKTQGDSDGNDEGYMTVGRPV